MNDRGQSRSVPLPGDDRGRDASGEPRQPRFGRDGAAGTLPPGPWPPCFAQGGTADSLPPGPLLGSLTELAIGDFGRLSDDELIGVLQATRRQISREEYLQVMVTAEFARRRQSEFEDAAARGVPVGCRPGGFPGEELAIELAVTRAEAGRRIDDAIDLNTRLPLTLAGMAAGLIDAERAGWIAMYTRGLSPEDAAFADAELSRTAPHQRPDQVARKAAKLEMQLDSEAAKARRERAKRDGQRVEARREASGNASLAGREMDTAEVMAAKAHVYAVADLLREGGLPGPIDRLRLLAYADLTQGRNPLDRLNPAQPAHGAGAEADPGAGDADEHADARDDDAAGGSGSGVDDVAPEPPAPGAPQPAGAHAGQPRAAPVPAQVNLIVPVGTLLGWSTAPAQAGTWGLLDPDETRAVVGAASRHPRTRWCCTLIGPDGTALAHACARGQHPGLLDDLAAQPPPGQLAEIIRYLKLTFTPVVTGACDYAQAEEHYQPSRALTHLVRARNATCDAPSCPSVAANADLDHTIAWPDGPTDQANLAPRCRRHHRAKQSVDWLVEKPTPNVTRWTLPSGRTHITRATTYDT